ncbi:hypothetical protein CR513_27302, partial [Mucuna pruriens]
MDPFKYIFENTALTRMGWIARWQMALLEYDIVYTSQKAIKGSALVGRVETLVRWSLKPTTRKRDRSRAGIPKRLVLSLLGKAGF